mmetsp:Transcript_13790/g.32186  ORF Transcript_13790/g.32186 Transcript_13790/m.32186 type:complete len:277 (-) Transcript_13790:814-1644(-)
MDQQKGPIHRARATRRGNAHADAWIRHPHPRPEAAVLEEETASLPGRAAVRPIARLRDAVLSRAGNSGKHGPAPGSQAGQHRVHAGRKGQAHRFRAGPDPGKIRSDLEGTVRDERRDGIPPVHGSGGGGGVELQPQGRRLLVRDHLLGDERRQAAVCRPQPGQLLRAGRLRWRPSSSQPKVAVGAQQAYLRLLERRRRRPAELRGNRRQDRRSDGEREGRQRRSRRKQGRERQDGRQARGRNHRPALYLVLAERGRPPSASTPTARKQHKTDRQNP